MKSIDKSSTSLEKKLNTAKAVCRNVKMGRKKLNLAAKYLSRSKNLSHAMEMLKINTFKGLKAFKLINQVLLSARANLVVKLNKLEQELKESNYLVKVYVVCGSENAKKYMPRGKGGMDILTKPTSHIFVNVEEVYNGT